MRNLRRSLAALIVVGLVAVVAPAPAGADTLDDLREKKEAAQKARSAAEKEIDNLEEDLEDTDADMAAAYVELKRVEALLPVAQAELDEAVATHTKAQAAADSLGERLEDAKSQESLLVTQVQEQDAAATTTRASIAELARRAYRGEGRADSLGLVVGASSTEDFVDRYTLSQTALRAQTNSLTDLQQAEATSRNAQARLAGVREQIASLKTEADAAVVAAQEAQGAAEKKKQEVAALVSSQQAQLAKIENRKAQQLAAKAQKEADAKALESEIQKVIGLTQKEKARLAAIRAAERKAAEEAAKKAAEDAKKNGSNPPTSLPGNDPPSSSKFLAYPVKNVHITSRYGYRMHPVLGYLRLHAGTDFRAYCGTPIYASAAGTVQWARYVSGFGNQVLINHGTVAGANLMTSYNHFSKFAVATGQRVSKGQLVGYSGTTGTSTACHLHFEVYVNGSTVNPMSML
ncbi:peptidoglycan DD-metalloendopeptidase family protein [Sanguibacter hominis ATCC BAA-789]|uniref:Peptidoglycan DD-metalloendopeptidase family protein n=1 Tax=Sanguibacter hominis ATCC BAA-789 TaxID=1312740 RepID=A0A9X5F9M1_9MICO|nr:M23 family metallopeptidase [Sanguibacter hominis]NKX91933.1 peptidoglycan DD-metalloendopeptidase family protein [Sanguibacter hominis ATCC BAA-789]